MKALSVWQPHADDIIAGSKTVENRGWATPYRGDLLIHAAQARWDVDGRDRRRGVILGTVRLVDVHRSADEHACRCATDGYAVGAEWNGQWSRWHWLLADPVALPYPLAISGRQGVWTLDTVEEYAVSMALLRGESESGSAG
jgi:activating signal cointegrator 1